MSKYTLAQAIINTAEKVKAAAIKVLQPLAALNTDILIQFDNIIEDLERNLEDGDVDNLELAGQIQNMIQLPVLATNNITERLDTYSDFVDALVEILPVNNDSTPVAINITLVIELSIVSVLVSMAQTVTTGLLQTRLKTLETANLLIDKLAEYTEILDDRQTVFNNNRIDRQYFSQLQSYASAVKMISAAVNYLLLVVFDLRIEKKFVLNGPRAPIEIVITEYGSLGANDENLDLFIESNSLKGNDILLLPAGKEVVVYV
jgi:hypothetical protein